MTKKELVLLAIVLPLVFLSLLSSDCEIEDFIQPTPMVSNQQNLFISPPNYTETTTFCSSVPRHDDEPVSYPMTTNYTSPFSAMGTSGTVSTTTS